MIVFHVTGKKEAFEAISTQKKLRSGRNVADGCDYVHLSRTAFEPGSWAVHIICGMPRRGIVAPAWIFVLDIPDDRKLLPDPSGEGETYGGEWVVYAGDELPVKILSVLHITDILPWEESGQDAQKRLRYEQSLVL